MKWTDKELQIVQSLVNGEIDFNEAFSFVLRTKDAILKKARELRKAGNTLPTQPQVPKAPRILVYDIEATDLSAGFGEMICFGYAWLGEKEVHVRTMYDYEGWDDLPVENRDKYLVSDLDDLFMEADVICGHYSTKYDLPFIQTRRLIHKLKPLPAPIHIDTWKLSKTYLKFNNNRLKTIAEGLRAPERKSKVDLLVWRRAKAHDLDAMKKIVKYNLQDVRTQVGVTEALLPFTKIMPNWNVFTGAIVPQCQSCGSTDLQSRGFAYTKLNKFQRYQCKMCGKWMRSRTSETFKDVERLV